MISFPELGKFGRLGNQLFQIAATLGCAFDHDDVSRFPRTEYSAFLSLPKEVWTYKGCSGPLYSEPCFSYRPIPYALSDARTQCLKLHGYFQSEKYFGRHGDLIRTLLTPGGVDVAVEDSVSVHVRRQDYLRLQDYHPTCGLDYYHRAFGQTGGRKLIIYSDDPDWCSKNFQGLASVAPRASAEEHFRAMLRSRHHVIANSSFSWWSAWLAERAGSIVVAPRRWFGPKGPQDAGDLIPSRWQRI